MQENLETASGGEGYKYGQWTPNPRDTRLLSVQPTATDNTDDWWEGTDSQCRGESYTLIEKSVRGNIFLLRRYGGASVII